MAQQTPHGGIVDSEHLAETGIEPPVEEEFRLSGARFQKKGAHSRSECEGVEARERRRHGYGEGELLVELPGDAGNECRGYEHAQKHKHFTDNRPLQFVHGFHCGLAWCELARVHKPRAVLDHNNSIVHNYRYGKHKAEERECIDGESHELHHRESGHKGHRNRYHRNHHRTPVLQEKQDYQHHYERCLEECDNHFVDGGVDKVGGVQNHLIVDILRKIAAELFESVLHSLGNLQGVGSRNLAYAYQPGLAAGNIGNHGIGLTAEFDPCHIAEPQHTAVASGAQYYVAELGGVGKAPARCQGELERLPRRIRRRPRRAGRHFGILALYGGHDIGRRYSAHAHQLRVEPHAHAVLSRAESLHIAYAVDSRKLVDNIQLGIVGKVQTVGRLRVARFHGYEKYHVRRTRHNLHPLLLHRRRQHGVGLAHPVLNLHCGDVEVGAVLESYLKRIRSVGTRGGTHIHHSLHTVHLLFDGHAYGLCHRLGIGSRIAGHYIDCRRRYVGELCHRQCLDREQSRQQHQYGDDCGENRTVDKKLAEHCAIWSGLVALPCRGVP